MIVKIQINNFTDFISPLKFTNSFFYRKIAKSKTFENKDVYEENKNGFVT